MTTMSAPAANALPAPVTTTTLTESSFCAISRARLISDTNFPALQSLSLIDREKGEGEGERTEGQRALRALGLLRVRRRIASFFSNSNSEKPSVVPAACEEDEDAQGEGERWARMALTLSMPDKSFALTTGRRRGGRKRREE